jgi:hypothetical protein
MMLARKLPYFNTKTPTLNLANLELGEGFRDFPFILFQSSFYFFLKILVLENLEHAMMGNKNMLWKRSK